LCFVDELLRLDSIIRLLVMWLAVWWISSVRVVVAEEVPLLETPEEAHPRLVLE
jgi:hypothetical protein